MTCYYNQDNIFKAKISTYLLFYCIFLSHPNIINTPTIDSNYILYYYEKILFWRTSNYQIEAHEEKLPILFLHNCTVIYYRCSF